MDPFEDPIADSGDGLSPIERLSRDLRTAARTLTRQEARYLVDYYYQMQGDRIRASHQMRTSAETGEPHEVLAWLSTQTGTLENQIKTALDRYSDADIVGQWSKSITGIGPIIAAGLLAHIDVSDAEKHTTVGSIWRFAGLDPTVTWEKGQKRPWNAALKVLCWKIGESFVKVSGLDSDQYGKVYLRRKALEMERNDRLEFADQAAASLKLKRFGVDTIARGEYEKGRLPQARIHARAKRYAVKLFLSHWHHVAYQSRFQTPPRKPYVLDHVHGHVDFIAPPNWNCTDGVLALPPKKK